MLSGVYTGDLDVALERAAAFGRVLATGAAFDADHLDDVDPSAAQRLTRGAASLVRTAEELEHAAVALAGRTGWSDVAHVRSGERAGPAPDRPDGRRRSPGRAGGRAYDERRRRAAVAPGSISSRFERPRAERRSAVRRRPSVDADHVRPGLIWLSPCVHARVVVR